MTELTKTLKAILHNLRLTQDDALWTAGDIAAYLSLAKSTVQSHILNDPSFPQPITLPKTGGKRWPQSLVKAWVAQNSRGEKR